MGSGGTLDLTTPGTTLKAGQELRPGAELRSPGQQYRLVMQESDGNLVLYRGTTALWSTEPQGEGTRAVMQGDGNFVLYKGTTAKWSTSTADFGGAELRLQDDGNLVVYIGPRPLWARTAGYLGNILFTDTWLEAGSRLRSANGSYRLEMQSSDGNLVLYNGTTATWNTGPAGAGARAIMQGDGNFVVYSNGAKWNSASDGFDGGAYLILQDDGNAVVYHRDHPLWASSAGYLGHRLGANEVLRPDAYLRSPNKQYRAVMQGSDGNLAVYGPGGALWGIGSQGHPGASAVMQGDGNFVVYGSGTALANTQTNGHPGAYLTMQDDSNLVVYQGATALWSRITGSIGGGGGGPNGPYGFSNAAIADRADGRANGSYGGQCLVFATNMIKAAGGPQFYFGYNTGTYQAQWAQRATQISGIANARRGDIIQWGGGVGGNLLHTAIITSPGSNPNLVDSNWGNSELVGRGSFSSRNIAGSVYRIWRVGAVG